MSRVRTFVAFAAGAAGLVLVAAQQAPALVTAQQAPALSSLRAGLWELDGLPGAKAPSRECIGDVQAFTRLEHRAASCSSKLISDNGHASVIEYSCGPIGFGRSQIDVITPRSLRINTQGISDSLPFNYTLYAHRVGECTAQATATRH